MTTSLFQITYNKYKIGICLLLLLGWGISSFGQVKWEIEFTYPGENNVAVEGKFVIEIPIERAQIKNDTLYLRPNSKSSQEEIEVEFKEAQFGEEGSTLNIILPDRSESPGIRLVGGIKKFGLKDNNQRRRFIDVTSEGSGTLRIDLTVRTETGSNDGTQLEIKRINKRTLRGENKQFRIPYKTIIGAEVWSRIEAIPADPYPPRLKALGAYMVDFPSGGSVAASFSEINEIAENEFQKAYNDRNGLIQYRDAFEALIARNTEVERANNRIEELDWEAAQKAGCLGYSTYLSSYPKGKFRTEAKAAILALDQKLYEAAMQLPCSKRKQALKDYLREMQQCGAGSEPAFMDEANAEIKRTCPGGGPPPPKPVQPRPIEKEFLALQKKFRDSALVCGDLLGFRDKYQEDEDYASNYARWISNRKAEICPIIVAGRSRENTTTFRFVLENAAYPVRIDTAFLAGQGFPTRFFTRTSPLNADSIVIITIPQPDDFELVLRDGRDSVIKINLQGSLQPISVFAADYDPETQTLSFRVTGGKPPYYIRLKADGQDNYVRGLYHLESESIGKDTAVYKLNTEEIGIPVSKGNYHFFVTDIFTDERQLQLDAPILIDNQKEAGWWKYLLVPLILMIGFLVYRHRTVLSSS